MKTDFIFPSFSGAQMPVFSWYTGAFPFQRDNPRDRNVRDSEGHGNIGSPPRHPRKLSPLPRGGEAVSPNSDIE